MSKAIRRLSVVLGLSKPAKIPAPVISSSSLLEFLTTSKESYLAGIPSKAQQWSVVMGNEAGDLDTLASSIAYAWLQSTAHNNPTIPYVQTDRHDLTLRAENIFALSLAGINEPGKELLLANDLASVKPFPADRFALVDHNRLGPGFTEDNDTVKVVAVLDHHDDEGLYVDSANPRTISPAGSCSSHVAALFAPDNIPTEVATLLLCAILIDTGGLKPGGKALKVDYSAAAFLVPRSTLKDSALSTTLSTLTDAAGLSEEAFYGDPSLRLLSEELARKKADVSHLSPLDHLRRDYKEYSYTLAWHPSKPTLKAGLSTVPVSLEAWAGGVKLPSDVESWMKSRELAILGVLTSFNQPKKFLKSGKGKHRREAMWIVRSDAPVTYESVELGPLDFGEVATRLWKGMDASDDLQVKKHKKFKPKALGPVPTNLVVKVYKQGNPKATRKVTAPLLKSTLEQSE